MKRLFFLGFAALVPVGCVSSIEEGVSITTSPEEDDAYSEALEKATRSRSVFKDFEARYFVHATYLSPEFRAAFQKRLERVYKVGTVTFEKASGKAGFFIAINAPRSDRVDIANPQHWTVLLNTPEGPQKPVLIERLDDKERWRAFFPETITHWTTDYLVVFDVPSVNPNSPALVEKEGVSLMLANADAQVSLTW